MTTVKKLLEAIEAANNAMVLSKTFGVITFIATPFAAEGITRKGFKVKLVKQGAWDGRNEPDPNVYTVIDFPWCEIKGCVGTNPQGGSTRFPNPVFANDRCLFHSEEGA